MILLNTNHYHLDVSVAVVHPGVRDTDVIVHPLDAAVQVDPATVVLHVVDSVVDVDPVVLVGQVPLQIVATVLINPELVVDLNNKDAHSNCHATNLHLLECPLHPGLALPDLVHLPPQAILHSIADKVDLLPALPTYF